MISSQDSTHKSASPAYLMGYFRSGPNQTHKVEKLHYAYSRDGLHWYELNGNKPVWSSTLGEGILRDPFMAKGPDGRFHLVFTIRPMGINIGYASTDDLIGWKDERSLPVMEGIEQARNSWAPEFTYDREQDDYLVYWASSCGSNMGASKHYSVRTKDWKKLSAPQLFFDPGYQTIDATLAEYEGKFVMAVKDESCVYNNEVKHACRNVLAVADKLEGPYELIPGFATPDHTEGPEFLKVEGTSKWLLIYDYWAYGKFGVMETEDFKEWKELEPDQFRFPYRARHATVLPITEQELMKLLDTYSLEGQYRPATYQPVRLAAEEAEGYLHTAFTMRTIALDIMPNTSKGIQMLYDEGDDTNGIAIRLNDGAIEAAVVSGGQRITVVSDQAAGIAGGKWLHAAVTFNEGQLSLYADGMLTGSAQAPFGLVGAHSGAGGYGGAFGSDAFGQEGAAQPFQGAIRQVHVYTVPLQEADIRLLASK